MNTNQVNQEVETLSAAGFDGGAPQAMALIMKLMAGLFYDPYEKTDWQTGEVSVENSLGFWQDGCMAGVLYQLHSKLEYSETTTLPKAKAAAQQAIRAHKGDEISETTLERANAWVERLIQQIGFAQQVLAYAEDEYTMATGKTYVYRSRQSANRDIVETPAMLKAKALGIGVANVAAGFGSAEPIGHERIEKLPRQDGRDSRAEIDTVEAALHRSDEAADRKRSKKR